MNTEEKKNKRKGLIVTIVTHTLLLLIFTFYGLKYPDPPPLEEGITINFGDTDAGRMTENPNQPAQQSTPQEVTPQSNESVDDVITSDNTDVPVIDKKPKKPDTKVEEKPIEKPVEKEPEPKPNKAISMADKMNSKNNQQSGGDGTTNQSGNQGDVNGDPNSTTYQGGGIGNDGVAFNLAGRVRKSTPKIEDNSQEEGTVVVEILVDRSGNVLRANPGARGSNTASPELYRKAKEAALKTKFNAKPDALETQKGTMTFIFILN